MSHKVLILAAAAVTLTAGAVFYSTNRGPDCSGGGRLCPQLPEIDVPGEKLALYDERARLGRAPAPGTLRAAVDQKKSLEFFKAGIKGADGQWQAYGKGPLIASGLAQTVGLAPVPDTYLQNYAGRIDNFAYDPINKRLFAAPGTGGIWMSEARNGDVRTIGDYWTSIGDKLPTQANGGIIYTPVGGGEGTVISAGGDGVLSTGAYTGLGAFWSNDLGVTWTRANGFPDEANVYNAKADPGHPNIVYIASSKGLYRSEDAGRNFVNVRLPTGSNGGVDCVGNSDPASPCNLVNVVTEVVVQAPGGVEIPGVKKKIVCSDSGCPVLTAVGWRAGNQVYPGTDIPQAPANGLYKSDTGLPGSFRRLDKLAVVSNLTEIGFAAPETIGRIEMGTASGPTQDHGYVYALVHDAARQNGAPFFLDEPTGALPPVPPSPTGIVLQNYGALSGIFASPDFGETWTRMATTQELAPFSAFTALVTPGVQGFYNMWIQVDPTRTAPGAGIPTRLAFGLEEIWQSRFPHVPLNGTLQAGPADFDVLGRYFSATGADMTTHPDQHAAIFIPIDDLPVDGGVADGVCLFVGNDGGVFRQCVTAGGEFTNAGWGGGNNLGMYTLLPYGLGVSKDGTVSFGLQDNGSGHIEPTGESFQDFGGDGFYAEIDPDNSDIQYTEAQNAGFRRTTDRGATATTITPPFTRPNFANWFSMDPLDGQHMITTANEIYETTRASTVTGSTWDLVYDVGRHTVVDGETEIEVIHTATVADVHGPAIYAGWCGDCGITVNDQAFRNGIVTNIGGSEPPSAGTSDGWHDAAAKGLPNRLIMAIEIDPTDPKTVYVGLGAYMSPYRGPGSFAEDSTGADIKAGNLFKSTDAGQTFKDISGSLPRLPIATILARNGQLLVGTDVGAFISSDLNGKQWAPLGKGLPNVPVTLFKLQPGNPNKLFAATFGRHVWTYEFTGDAAMKVADLAAVSGKRGSGFFLGAFSPWMLLGLLMGALKRATRSVPKRA